MAGAIDRSQIYADSTEFNVLPHAVLRRRDGMLRVITEVPHSGLRVPDQSSESDLAAIAGDICNAASVGPGKFPVALRYPTAR